MMFASAGSAGASEQPVEAARVLTPHRPNYQFPIKDDPPPPYYQTQLKEDHHLTHPSENEVTPLTKAQLMQAFNYLLKVISILNQVQSLKMTFFNPLIVLDYRMIWSALFWVFCSKSSLN